jgi:replicative DNA helicase
MTNLFIDYEKHLVTAALQDAEARAEIFLKLRPEHFQDTACRAMFGAARNLYLAGKTVDVFSAAKAGKVADYHEFLNADFFIHLISIPAAVKALQDRHDRQRLEHRLNECLITLKNEAHADFDDTRAAVAEKLFKALSEGAQDDETHPADACLAMYEKSKAAGCTLSGVPSGFNALDEEIGGLQPGTLTIYGGRSSHGKSTLAQDTAYHASAEIGIPCLYVSLEQPAHEVYLFMLQKTEGINPIKIKAGALEPTQEFNLKNALKNLKASPLYFYDSSSRLEDILLKARSMVHAKKIKLLLIDYLQLVENPLKGEPRHLQVAGVSRALKRLAMDTGLAIVALSQLNRGPEERGGAIRLSDIRESDAICHDADHVVFINRPKLYGEDGTDFLQLEKNRHGRTVNKISVHWNEKKNTYLALK